MDSCPSLQLGLMNESKDRDRFSIPAHARFTYLASARPYLVSSTFRSERRIPASTVACLFSLSTCKRSNRDQLTGQYAQPQREAHLLLDMGEVDMEYPAPGAIWQGVCARVYVHSRACFMHCAHLQTPESCSAVLQNWPRRLSFKTIVLKLGETEATLTDPQSFPQIQCWLTLEMSNVLRREKPFSVFFPTLPQLIIPTM